MASWDEQYDYNYPLPLRLDAARRTSSRRAGLLGEAAAAIRGQEALIERLTSKLQAAAVRAIKTVPATPALDEAAALLYDGHDVGRGRLTLALAGRAIIEADKALQAMREELGRK